MFWISDGDYEEAKEIMKKWEAQGCTYADIETKIAALSSYFSRCKKQLDNEPFKMPTEN